MILADASRVVDAAIAEAERSGLKVSVAVVDGGGHLVAFARMDGAEIAGTILAIDKAYTAVANSMSTADLGRLAAPGGELFGIHANGGGRYVIFGGGLPLLARGVIVGGIGVSGASAAQDAHCATHASRAYPQGQ